MARKAGALTVFSITSAKRMRECCGTLRCVEIGLGTVFCAARRTRQCCGGLRCEEVGVLGLFCAARRTRECCGWLR